MTNAQFFGPEKFRPFFHKKKIVRTQGNHMVEMKKGMAGPALDPGFLESKSWVFNWIPEAHMDSS